MQLSDIKGVGPKRIELFRQLHIETPEDLLRFYPKEYLDDTHCSSIAELHNGEKATVYVRVLNDPTIFYHNRKYIVSVSVSDGSKKATLRWMNQPYRMQQIHAGEMLYATGIVNQKRGTVFYNPQISKEKRGIVPVYPSVKGLPQAVIREAVEAVLNTVRIPELLPQEWLDRYDLIGSNEAVRYAHFPKTSEEIRSAKRRLSFEDAFLYFTVMMAQKDDHYRRNGNALSVNGSSEAFLKRIPYQPTSSQLRVMREVENDLRSPACMNRLIQGDVGSGKTLVALYALWIAAQNHKQCVMLAPTEILAQQHFRKLRSFFANACLYTGSLRKNERTAAVQTIESGEADLIVGTHALLSDNVRFRDLGLVVTDEQHRFGVMQRAKIEAKGIRPDVLVMSATPIPRTLALLIYADLDLSIIDEMPQGRKPVKTHFVPQEKRDALYHHLEQNARSGERSYVICPLIEPSEGYEGLSLTELETELRTELPDTSIGILYGQMKDAQKQQTMDAFRRGDISILLSTTVVEVGVDVPEATSIVIEGADHFGLATLHQLRGRVGRGEMQSHCYLLSRRMTDASKSRIQAMLDSNDGFEIAQRDLEMRGMGDLFGVRQSGNGEIGDMLSNCTVEILELASEAAREVGELPDVMHNALFSEAMKRYCMLTQIAHN